MSDTPIADRLAAVLSRVSSADGHADAIIIAVRALELKVVAHTKSSSADLVKVDKRREKERDRKKRWRAAQAELSRGRGNSDSLTVVNNKDSIDKERKKDTGVPDVRPRDTALVEIIENADRINGSKPVSPGQSAGQHGWPGAFFEEFWELYPSGRKGQKEEVRAKLVQLRDGKAKVKGKPRPALPWAELMAGVRRYVASEPGEYSKAPLAWLNSGLWDTDYKIKRGPDRQMGFMDIVARLPDDKPHR